MEALPVDKELSSQPTGIAVAPNGIVWFVTFGSNQLGRLDPTTESIDLYMYPRQVLNWKTLPLD